MKWDARHTVATIILLQVIIGGLALKLAINHQNEIKVAKIEAQHAEEQRKAQAAAEVRARQRQQQAAAQAKQIAAAQQAQQAQQERTAGPTMQDLDNARQIVSICEQQSTSELQYLRSMGAPQHMIAAKEHEVRHWQQEYNRLSYEMMER